MTKEFQLKWHHPFFQSTLVFLAEFLCGVIFFISRKIKKYEKSCREPLIGNHKREGRFRIHPLVYMVPALLDSLGAICLFTGLTQVAASIYQMIRGFVVVVTAGLTMLVLKKRLIKH